MTEKPKGIPLNWWQVFRFTGVVSVVPLWIFAFIVCAVWWKIVFTVLLLSVTTLFLYAITKELLGDSITDFIVWLWEASKP